MLIEVRANLFALSFYIVTALFLLIGSPLLFAPRNWAMAGLRMHARACLLLLKVIAGTRYEVRGLENLPDRPCLVVAKHQSAWETFALIPLLKDPAIVLKFELTRIPLYGWFCRKFEHVLVDRAAGARALKDMVRTAKMRVDEERQILIFAEGTRQVPGAPPDYKPGFVALYDGLGIPAVPLALNSGVFWPARSAKAYSGTIVVDIGPAVPPGLDRKLVKKQLIAEIEARTDALLREANGTKPTPTGSCSSTTEA
ncbi:MAG: 1-acyl-sn-glycerol-3-phosphate acyltransferase [Pseudomonadota bacterium]